MALTLNCAPASATLGLDSSEVFRDSVEKFHFPITPHTHTHPGKVQIWNVWRTQQVDGGGRSCACITGSTAEPACWLQPRWALVNAGAPDRTWYCPCLESAR